MTTNGELTLKKIKKLLTIGLTLFLIFCTGVGFTACNIPADSSSTSQDSASCEHTYEWIKTEHEHQKVYTCGCQYPENAELHTDNDKNAYCDICEYYVGVEHCITPDHPDKSLISLSPEIESQFDLSQEKIWWNSNTNADYTDNAILICFKKTTTYPELSIEDFNFENAESMRYLALRPSGGMYENAEKYTQIAIIYLKEKGRDKVIEAVLYFERISIILCAEPDFLAEAD